MKKSSRETEWKQKRYPTVGVDLGDRFSRYCALNRDGEVIEEGQMQGVGGSKYFPRSRTFVTGVSRFC